MKTTNKILLASALTAMIGGLGITAVSMADDDGERGAYERDHGDRHQGRRHDDDDDHGGHKGEHHGKHERRGQRQIGEWLEQYDANKDGALTLEEINQGRRARLDTFDTDANGALDLEEFTQLWLDSQHERMVDRFQALDNDGDASVTIEEFLQPGERMAKRLDRNSDGQISEDDWSRSHR